MSVDNPLGVDPDDPNGRDDIIIANPIMHLPVNQPVKALLRSTDVLHDFAVPQFRVKMDLVPGTRDVSMVHSRRSPGPTRSCARSCAAPATSRCAARSSSTRPRTMRLAREAAHLRANAGAPGRQRSWQAPPNYAVCSACHGAKARVIHSSTRPKLAGQDGWYMRRQVHIFQQRSAAPIRKTRSACRWRRWRRRSPDPAALENVIAHIASLPDKPAPADGGRRRRARPHAVRDVLALCHGDDGKGRWGTNAPRLAGMSDWYLQRQLGNFKARECAAVIPKTSTATKCT